MLIADDIFEIFLTCPPGLEPWLLADVIDHGFKKAKRIHGGVTIQGGWVDVWRANLVLRGPSKVFARIGEFRAMHPAQLDKRARKFPWERFLSPANSYKVEVTTGKQNRIYHAGAAIERLERAIAEELGGQIAGSSEDADVIIKARIVNNNVILSIDTSGEGLHKRGHKQGVGKAPMRETMAALLLRGCGYDGTIPVLDPMCGSGTFIIEAAEMASRIWPGRSRAFAFEKLPSFAAGRFQMIKSTMQVKETDLRFYGSDRNVNVIQMANDNAARSGVNQLCTFHPIPLSQIERPGGPPGLVMVNPPYGARVGKKKDLYALYGAFGDIMRERFTGWRIGMVTSDTNLAQTTKLDWDEVSDPIAHGGLKVRLFVKGL